MPSPNSSDDLKVLIEIYKIIVEEYRFQINLNWDRNKFYLFLNSGLITANFGLLKIPEFKFAEFLTAPLFLLGFLSGWLGYKTLTKGIEYHRRVAIKKAQLEIKLQSYLIIVPVDTTKGMKDIKDIEEHFKRPPRLGTINYFLAAFFIFLMILNAIALLYLVIKNI